ncbi:ubiquitin-conjugating enzyme/RWD-like protein [Schizophyllum commune]
MPPPGLSSQTTLKRIHREIADLKKEDLNGIKLAPDETNVYLWRATIPGPEGSLYEGGSFDVEIHLPADYPFSAPKVAFKTRIYHMNISDAGHICLDILKNKWSPALSLFKVILSLSSLLTDPNPDDPLVALIAQQYKLRRKEHDETARAWTRLYAMGSRDKGKGKMIAPPAPLPRARPPRPRFARPPASSDVIVVDDSDEERSSSGRTRKRKRGAVADGEVIDLVDEDEDEPARKRSVRTGSNAGLPDGGDNRGRDSSPILIE